MPVQEYDIYLGVIHITYSHTDTVTLRIYFKKTITEFYTKYLIKN